MPVNGFQQVRVHVNEDRDVCCMRCNKVMSMSRIAAFTRTSPQDPFEAWCHGCFLVMVEAARVGMELANSFLGT